MSILLKNGRIFCPASGMDQLGDLLVEGPVIAELGGSLPAGDAEVIDCQGLWVTPGLIDMHVHLREPGHEYKETIASGTRAAAAGGFTAVAPMPNTNPVNDSRSVTDFILEQSARHGAARVYPVGAITKDLAGRELTEMAELKEAGCVAVSDDGKPVAASRMLRRAMEYAATFDLPVICHSEDPGLADGGVMHEGEVSTRLGLAGIPAEAEVTAVERDLALALLTGARVHIAHISCAGSVAALARAKAAGGRVSGETAPHYLALDHRAVGEYDTHAKMNPPLRTPQDVAAVRQGLADGTIDALATDHAPHSVLEKAVEFDLAAFGVVGLETALGVVMALVEQGELSLARAIEAMTARPAAILDLPGGRLQKGGPADICVMDPAASWRVDPQNFYSLSRNTPFAGHDLVGRAILTICGGEITHRFKEETA